MSLMGRSNVWAQDVTKLRVSDQSLSNIQNFFTFNEFFIGPQQCVRSKVTFNFKRMCPST